MRSPATTDVALALLNAGWSVMLGDRRPTGGRMLYAGFEAIRVQYRPDGVLRYASPSRHEGLHEGAADVGTPWRVVPYDLRAGAVAVVAALDPLVSPPR